MAISRNQRQSEAVTGNQWSDSALAGSMIEGNQTQSVAISGNQWQSVAARRGNQRQSVVWKAPWRSQSSVAIRSNQIQSDPISGNQRLSEAIRGNQMQSDAIRGNQRQSVIVQSVPWGVEDHQALERSPADSRAPGLWACTRRRRGRIHGAVCGLDARVGAHLWGKSGGAVVGTCMQGRGRVSALTPRTCCTT